MRYLLGVTIGPIQSNIQESKKLKDLNNSSRIVSDLIKVVAKYLKRNDNEIIYPAIDEKIDATNYLICQISNLEILKGIEDNVFSKDLSTGSNRDILKEIFFLFWAVEEVKEDKTYYENYKALRKKLQGIKNTYEFYNEMESGGGKKCSICGKRTRVNSSDICKICEYKRNYRKVEKYPSLDDISISYWHEKNKDRLKTLDEKIESTFKSKARYYNPDEILNIINILNRKDYENILRRKDIRSDLLLVDNMIDKEIFNTKLEEIKNEMNSIFDNKENPIDRPHYQYSFIQIDIDNLGKWISGEFNYDKDELLDSQKEISYLLKEFGIKLREELNGNKLDSEPYSKLEIIYNGGDDFLAVVPIELTFATLKLIENHFTKIVQNKLYEIGKYEIKMTYSTGITIAGAKEDMAFVLRENRKILEKVKKRFENEFPAKNGIGINYIVNSSKVINAYFKNSLFKDYIENLNDFNKFKDDISFSYINSFEDEFSKMNFNEVEFYDYVYMRKIMGLEFERIFRRSIKKGKVENLEDYIESNIKLFNRIAETNYTDRNMDFKNIMNCYKVYEKLSNFDLFQGGDKN